MGLVESVHMRNDTEAELAKRLEQLEVRIGTRAERSALHAENSLNEWVFDYAPQQELIVRTRIRHLQRKYDGSLDTRLLVIDIYELIIEHLEENGYLELNEELEADNDFSFVVSAVKNTLRIASSGNIIVKKIIDRMGDDLDNTVVFLTGIGKCFPLLTGKEILDKVLYTIPEQVAAVPVVLFYPGTYTESELITFNEQSEGNHYRALRIVR